MHRTQIYFDETLFLAIKERAALLGVSVSAYIRDALKRDLAVDAEQASGVTGIDEFAGLWEGRDIDQARLRKAAWK